MQAVRRLQGLKRPRSQSLAPWAATQGQQRQAHKGRSSGGKGERGGAGSAASKAPAAASSHQRRGHSSNPAPSSGAFPVWGKFAEPESSSEHLASIPLPQQAPLQGLAGLDERLLVELASKKSTPLSLRDLYSLSSASRTPQQQVQQAQFLHQELSVRFAKAVVELLELPYGLSEKEPVLLVASWYAEMVSKLASYPVPQTPTEETQFSSFLASLLLDNKVVPSALSKALHTLREEAHLGGAKGARSGAGQIDVHRLDHILDHFFTSRISMRFLVKHYIASKEKRPGYAGLIASNCSPVEIAGRAAKDVERLSRLHLGTAPEIQIYGVPNLSFTAVPTHLYYILCELLKNSCIATVKKHHQPQHHNQQQQQQQEEEGATQQEGVSATALPPIKVVVVQGREDVTIKVADEGGGIKRSDLHKAWSYMYSTSPSTATVSPPPLGGLPLEDCAHAGQGLELGVGLGRSPLLGPGLGMDQFGRSSSSGGESGPQDSQNGHKEGHGGASAEEVAEKARYAFAGLGMGLPLSRVYARYFGGSLKLRPLEGYGTDAYLHLNRLRAKSEECLPSSLDRTISEMQDDGRCLRGRPAWTFPSSSQAPASISGSSSLSSTRRRRSKRVPSEGKTVSTPLCKPSPAAV